MRQKIIKDIAKGCMPIEAGFIIAAVFCLMITLYSCKAQREVQVERVEVPVPIVQEHTIESMKIDHVRDTLIQRDSIFHYVKGDTVLIEKWHWLQGSTNAVRVDTLIKYDSIEVPVEVFREKTKTVTQIKEVEKPLKWWQQALMWMGFGLLCLIGYKVVRLAR